ACRGGAMAESPGALRRAGNEEFRRGQYGPAAALYTRALALLEASGTGGPGGGRPEGGRTPVEPLCRLCPGAGDAAAEERSVLLANRAACHLKDGACSLCVADCSRLPKASSSLALNLSRDGASTASLGSLLCVCWHPSFLSRCWLRARNEFSVSSRMTKALLEKDGTNWRQKLPAIPSVPVSAQMRWSVPSAAAPGANTPPATAPRGEPGENQAAAGTERARTLKEEGNELVKKGNHKKAVEKYSESLKLNQECATYTNRALCYLALKQYKEAVQDCTEALRLDPKNVKALYRRAQALKELKDYKSSIADIKSLLKTEPKNTAALRLLQELNRA
ncbi:TOM34 protein, partial [Pterocles burchelli]|nr:TOM34 protein [Pterocles burchelli]